MLNQTAPQRAEQPSNIFWLVGWLLTFHVFNICMGTGGPVSWDS